MAPATFYARMGANWQSRQQSPNTASLNCNSLGSLASAVMLVGWPIRLIVRCGLDKTPAAFLHSCTYVSRMSRGIRFIVHIHKSSNDSLLEVHSTSRISFRSRRMPTCSANLKYFPVGIRLDRSKIANINSARTAWWEGHLGQARAAIPRVGRARTASWKCSPERTRRRLWKL